MCVRSLKAMPKRSVWTWSSSSATTSNEIVERRIFLDGKRANSLGVKGTPTVFLNGRELPFESLAPDKLRCIISTELAAHP